MLLNFHYNKKNHMICILVLLQVKSSITDEEKNLSLSEYVEVEGFQKAIETNGNKKSYFNSSNMQCVPSPYTLPSFNNSYDYYNQQNSSCVCNSSNFYYDHSVASNSIQNNKDSLENICFNKQDCNFIFEQNKFYSQLESNQYMEIKENLDLEFSNQEYFNNNTNLISLSTIQNTNFNYQEYQKDLYRNSPENNYQNNSCVANNNKFLYSQNLEGSYKSDYQNRFELKSCDYQDNTRNIHNVMTYNLNEINQPNNKRKIEIMPKEVIEEKLSNSVAVEKCQFIKQKQTINDLDNVEASNKYLLYPISTDQKNTVLFQENKKEMPESNPYYNKFVPFLRDINHALNLENNHNMDTRCKKDPHNKYNERCLKNKLKEVKQTDIQVNIFQKEKNKDTTCLDDLLSISSSNKNFVNEDILNKSITIDENESKLHFNKKKSIEDKNFKFNHKKGSTIKKNFQEFEILDFNKNTLNKYKNEIINMNKEIQKYLDVEKNTENTICIINKIIEFLKFNNSENNFRFSLIQSELIEINFLELEEAINSIRTDNIFKYILPEFEFFGDEYFQTFYRNQNIIHETIFNTWILFLKKFKHILRTVLDKKIEIAIEILKHIIRCFTFIAIEFLFDHDFRSLQYKFLDTELILKLKFDQNHKNYFCDYNNNHIRRSGYFSKYSQHFRFIFLLKKRQLNSKKDSISSTKLNLEKNAYLKNFLENFQVKNSDFYFFRNKIVISTIFFKLSRQKDKCLPYLKVILLYCSNIKYKNIYADFLHEIVNVENEICDLLQYYMLDNKRSRYFRVDENAKSIQDLENKKKLCKDKKNRQLFLTKKFQEIISLINILFLNFEKKEIDWLKLNLKKNKHKY